ncbi:hypothetical protein B1757_12740 [Acidithiobacillus marinus]|uniref:Carbohydrate kinase n=1 Tax=Acidithiobacillus marinus TaxID=187490 RepID=A0A2I1DJ17_9PROT|nr:FGGY-family carbohydrate kinase [Acidithiobacillus marinus]PKY09859.1 hypothetical protein B1757_12740 [Acidithiobacillus marinus]
MPTYLGVDLGTSGLRGVLLDDHLHQLASVALPYPGHPPENFTDSQTWLSGLEQLTRQLRLAHPRGWAALRAMSLDGTSGTLLLCNQRGQALGPALAYSDQRAVAEADWLQQQWPAGGVCLSPSSSLSKLLWLRLHHADFQQTRFVQHQADWVAAQLTGKGGIADRGNLLKIGLDPQTRAYPAALLRVLETWDIDPAILPHAVVEGSTLGRVQPQWAERLGMTTPVEVRAGCTDSVAAALAAGLNSPGKALTSLGSSLAFKFVHPTPLNTRGLYSHYLGDFCLPGAASNAGAGALLRIFQPEQMTDLEPALQPEYPTGQMLYPLLTTGERFPIRAPDWPGSALPAEANAHNFQALLEGLCYIEAWSYALMETAGGKICGHIRSVGGGTRNHAWMQMRSHVLNRPVEILHDADPARGAALLAASADLGGVAALEQADIPSGQMFYPENEAVERYAPQVQQFQEMFTRFST